MPNPASNFRMVADKTRRGIAYWRVYFHDPATPSKLRKLSTGIEDDGSKANRLTAEEMARRHLERLHAQPVTATDTLEHLGKDFWDWERSPYIRARLARDPKALSQEHARNKAYYWKNHVATFVTQDGLQLVNIPVDEITPDVLDELVTHLLDDKGLSTQSVKHVIGTLSPVFEQAIRKRKARFNPVKSMLPFGIRHKKRQAFTPEEARALLNPAKVTEIWADPTRHNVPYRDGWRYYAMSLLVACTASRWSMVAALNRQDVRPAEHAGQRYYEVTLERGLAPLQGVKAGSKTGAGTVVPVAAELIDRILPHLPESGPLFPGWGGHGIITHHTAVGVLHQAMSRAKISAEEQGARMLGFHAWRHTWETRARAAGLAREIRQNFTEHREEDTADGYAHLKPFELLGALVVQRGMVG